MKKIKRIDFLKKKSDKSKIMRLTLPFSYRAEECQPVKEATERFIQNDLKLSEALYHHCWAYHSLMDIIPQYENTFFSGNYFPLIEGFEELQLSYNLCCLGFYKQSMVSLRSSLELGLLSVYWNLDDDGHITIQHWLNSKEDTPRMDKVWKKLQKNAFIRSYDEASNFKQRLLSLNGLHNFVHSKGVAFSNRTRLFKSNVFTFEEVGFTRWFHYFKEVVEIVIILHLLKYPLGLVEFDYSSKYGIDKPLDGGLDSYQIDHIISSISKNEFEKLKELTKDDEHVGGYLKFLNSLPDLTKEDIERQAINWHKQRIESEGLENWLKWGHLAYEGDKKEIIEELIQWAKDNGFEKSEYERMRGRSL